MPLRLHIAVPLIFLISCAADSDVAPLDDYQEVQPVTTSDAPSPQPGQSAPGRRERAVHGEYLVELLGWPRTWSSSHD